MRTLLLAALVAGVSVTAASAQDAAAPTRYFAGAIGAVGSSDYDYLAPTAPISVMQAELDGSFSALGAVGMSLGPNFRGEVSVAATSHDLGGERRTLLTGSPISGSVTVVTLDANVYYDLPLNGPVRPYVGAGLGTATLTIDDGILDDTGTTLNVQAMAGVSYRVNNKVSLFVEGRWQRIGTLDIEITGPSGTFEDELEFSNSAGYAGVRVGF